MRAVRLHDTGDLRFEAVALPSTPAEGEIRVRVAYAGICGSDIHNFKTGQWITRRPSTAGHEFAGVVHSVGKGVCGLGPGDAVVADSRDYCGSCPKCSSGRNHVCENLGFVGESRDGGFADYVDFPARLVFKCAADTRLDVMALAEPLAVALHALTKIRVGEGPILIIGCGPIGALAAVASRLLSRRQIYLTDRNEGRAALVADLVDGERAEISEIASLSNRPEAPVSHVLDTTGSVDVIESIMSGLSDATLGLVGIGNGILRFDPVHAVEREFSVVGCHAFADELPWAIELLERNTSAFLPLISHRISLEDVPREFEKIAGGAAQGIKTLIDIGS